MHISFADTKLYKVVVEKNPYIKEEYDNYIQINRGNRKNNRLREWFFLAQIIILYFVFGIKLELSSQNRYMKTSESQTEKRIPPQHFVKHLLSYDVISFDVFDTLIFRPFSNPMILFDILESENQINDFAKIRGYAEEQVRNQKKNTKEITLDEIYEYIEKYTGLDQKEGIINEIEKEIELCFANPYMLNIFNMLREHGERIIITSDMYLSKEIIERILKKNGYWGYEELFVSCQYGKSKESGELYKMIRSRLGEELSYIHIGDNSFSDFDKAKEVGWDVIYYSNVNKLGEKYRAEGMSKLIGAASEGIINARLHNGMYRYSPAYEFGYANGGLYCLGYVGWIHDYALKNDVQKVIFLAQDGNVYKKIYDRLYTDIKSEYMYWSQTSMMKCNIDKYQYDFIRKMVDNTDSSLEEILERVDLQGLTDDLYNYGLDKNEKISEDNADIFEKFIIENMVAIKSICTKEEYCAQKYFSDVIGVSVKIAVVAVGWDGNYPLGIKGLIEEKWKWNCKVECLLAATSDEGTYKILSDKLHVYMFAKNYNRIHYDFHFNSKREKVSNDCLELLTRAAQPQFKEYKCSDGNYTMNFASPCVEGYEYIREIHRGILDFAKDYTTVFQKYKIFMNISGHDAYCVFGSTMQNLNYYQQNFEDFPYEYSMGVNEKTVNLGRYFEDRGVN